MVMTKRKVILTIVFFLLLFFSFVAYDYFVFDRYEWGLNFSKTLMTFFFFFLFEWSSTNKKQKKTH